MLWVNLTVDTVNPDNVFEILDDVINFRFVGSGRFFGNSGVRDWCTAIDKKGILICSMKAWVINWVKSLAITTDIAHVAVKYPCICSVQFGVPDFNNKYIPFFSIMRILWTPPICTFFEPVGNRIFWVSSFLNIDCCSYS